MSVFQGLLAGNTWQLSIIGTPGALDGDGEAEGEGEDDGTLECEGDGDGALEREGDGDGDAELRVLGLGLGDALAAGEELPLGLGLEPFRPKPGGFIPAPPPEQAAIPMIKPLRIKAVNHFIYSGSDIGQAVPSPRPKCDAGHTGPPTYINLHGS